MSGRADPIAPPTTAAKTVAIMLRASVGCCPHWAGAGKRPCEATPAATGRPPQARHSARTRHPGRRMAGIRMRMIVGRSSCTHQNVFAVRSTLLSAGDGFTKAETAASVMAAGVCSAPAAGRLRPLPCAGLPSHLISPRLFVQAVKRAKARSRSNAPAAFGRHAQSPAVTAWRAVRCRRGV